MSFRFWAVQCRVNCRRPSVGSLFVVDTCGVELVVVNPPVGSSSVLIRYSVESTTCIVNPSVKSS